MILMLQLLILIRFAFRVQLSLHTLSLKTNIVSNNIRTIWARTKGRPHGE